MPKTLEKLSEETIAQLKKELKSDKIHAGIGLIATIGGGISANKHFSEGYEIPGFIFTAACAFSLIGTLINLDKIMHYYQTLRRKNKNYQNWF